LTQCVIAVIGVAAAACEPVGPGTFDGPVQLGGETVSAMVLNQGRSSFNLYCRSCHGPRGDGMGPLGLHQKPPARDLRLGIIKFAAVPAGSLPTDADLRRVIEHGLEGTAMLGWHVPQNELNAVVQYVKSFSPRWRRGERAGTPIAVSKDPWGARTAEAVRRGEVIYHGEARCVTCHPAEVPASRLPADMRADAAEPRVTDSVYGPIVATDLARGTLRMGDAPEALYRVIAAGVGGTAMPTWKGALSEDDLWALVHYIRSLRAAHADNAG